MPGKSGEGACAAILLWLWHIFILEDYKSPPQFHLQNSDLKRRVGAHELNAD